MEPQSPSPAPAPSPAGPPSLPPTLLPAPPPKARVRLRWHPVFVALIAVLILTAGTIGLAGFARAPYVVYAPGSAIPAEPAISAPGTETYESDGEILFLTVSLRGASRRMGYIEALAGWLTGDQDVYPRDAILGGQTGEENRQAAVQEMALSQEVAAKVALEHLGYDVPVDGTGTMISDTIPDSPAAEVLEPFDTITELDGTPTPTDAELRSELEGREPGDVVQVTFERDRDGDPATEDDLDERTEGIELIADPEDPERTLLGVVQVFTRDLSYELPFPVQIDTEDVGGPSAGLALTLGILDVLTPGSITGERVVATTGTIDPTGVVGEVGGVGQKAVAAEGQGAELMLVPASEAEIAERYADDMRVVGVETLDDALEALADIGGNALDLPDDGG